jgi:AhpD family alkylhydroperoxidase
VAKLTVLSNELRLLIRLAVATANQCRYCTAHQRHQLANLGVSEAKMAAIWKPDADELSPRERAAVRFAQAITIDAGGLPAEVYAEFVREFTPKERIEVAIVATSMGMLNKLNDALRVPLESEFEALLT